MSPARRFSLIVLALLAIVGCSLVFWFWPHLPQRAWFLGVALAALCAPLPGIIRQQRRTYAWATLLMIAYIVLGLTEVLGHPEARFWPALLLFASFATFVMLVAYLRVSRVA